MLVDDSPEGDLAQTFDLQEEAQRVSIVRQAIEIDRDLRVEGTPLKLVLDAAREDAAEAVKDLLKVDPSNADAIRELQWKVKRYSDMNSYIVSILAQADEATADLTDVEASEFEQDIKSVIEGE